MRKIILLLMFITLTISATQVERYTPTPVKTKSSNFKINGIATDWFNETGHCIIFRSLESKTIDHKICGNYHIESFNGVTVN